MPLMERNSCGVNLLNLSRQREFFLCLFVSLFVWMFGCLDIYYTVGIFFCQKLFFFFRNFLSFTFTSIFFFLLFRYEIVDKKTGKKIKKKSLLLASGFWGQARHLQYLFELMAAWSWCLLANPFVNGVLPLFYAAFLTYLLIDRAERDSKKCHLKYGKYYEEYCQRVPYKIIPGIW